MLCVFIRGACDASESLPETPAPGSDTVEGTLRGPPEPTHTQKKTPACLLGCNLPFLKYPASLSQEFKKAPGWSLGDAAPPTSAGGH